jgi:hypothetical protein
MRLRAANSLHHALLLTETLAAKIEKARLCEAVSPEWADELSRYQGSLADLISAIPINLP